MTTDTEARTILRAVSFLKAGGRVRAAAALQFLTSNLNDEIRRGGRGGQPRAELSLLPIYFPPDQQEDERERAADARIREAAQSVHKWEFEEAAQRYISAFQSEEAWPQAALGLSTLLLLRGDQAAAEEIVDQLEVSEAGGGDYRVIAPLLAGIFTPNVRLLKRLEAACSTSNWRSCRAISWYAIALIKFGKIKEAVGLLPHLSASYRDLYDLPWLVSVLSGFREPLLKEVSSEDVGHLQYLMEAFTFVADLGLERGVLTRDQVERFFPESEPRKNLQSALAYGRLVFGDERSKEFIEDTREAFSGIALSDSKNIAVVLLWLGSAFQAMELFFKGKEDEVARISGRISNTTSRVTASVWMYSILPKGSESKNDIELVSKNAYNPPDIGGNVDNEEDKHLRHAEENGLAGEAREFYAQEAAKLLARVQRKFPTKDAQTALPGGPSSERAAVERYADRPIRGDGTRESPEEFILRVHGDPKSTGLTYADVRRLDPQLYRAIANLNRPLTIELPRQKDLPPKLPTREQVEKRRASGRARAARFRERHSLK